MEDRKALRVMSIANDLDVHEDTVRRWIKSGKLRAVKRGGIVFINPADLDSFLELGGDS